MDPINFPADSSELDPAVAPTRALITGDEWTQNGKTWVYDESVPAWRAKPTPAATEAEMRAGTEEDARVMSPLRVAQAIDELAAGDSLTFGTGVQEVHLYDNAGTSTFTYGTGAAAAHRTALGLGTAQSPTFAGVVLTDLKLEKSATGVVEINDGNLGTWRDLKLRNLTATGTVAAGNGSDTACAYQIGAANTGWYSSGGQPALAKGGNLIFYVNNSGSFVTHFAVNFVCGGVTESTSAATGSIIAAGGIGAAGNLNAGGYIKPGIYTVSTAPNPAPTPDANNTFGQIGITDALTPAIGSAVVTGGAQKVICTSNGTNWIVTAILT